ncbi:hypothetical protein G5714_017350 [Onychostoma macrolepis]|uniref:Uncharacterized protein n=1 Tax=Onychostoma macrolepis TaxID=369639 RepID=A0A7J6C5Q8_9TELE|nr:hypothetical protein G5714_017350 [Onychostoma macrolepis]
MAAGEELRAVRMLKAAQAGSAERKQHNGAGESNGEQSVFSQIDLLTAQLMSEHEAQNEIIDLTDECSACFEKPGPSFSDNARSPLKKKKRNVACIIPNLRRFA